MPYLIDSDSVIDHLGEIPEAATLLARLSDEPLYISIVTYMEVYEGALRTADPSEGIAKLLEFIVGVPVLPLDTAVVERCARLRHLLRQQRKTPNRRALDLLIAATAIENDLVLVTRNVQDYEDLPDLKIHGLH